MVLRNQTLLAESLCSDTWPLLVAGQLATASHGLHAVDVLSRDDVQVPVPTVGKHERTLVREMPFAGFYRVVTRYGYMDEVQHSTWSLCSRCRRRSKLLKARVGSAAFSCGVCEVPR